jgi:SAM-dependent methyltransferase
MVPGSTGPGDRGPWRTLIFAAIIIDRAAALAYLGAVLVAVKSWAAGRRVLVMKTNHVVLDGQRQHWQATFEANPGMYGADPSMPGRYAIDLFAREKASQVLELGAGQGRDTLAFLRAGLTVTAMDYAPNALAELTQAATAAGLAGRLATVVHDVRQPLPLPDGAVDAVYSHMLFNMALTTAEVESLAREVRRVLRPGGWHVYTVRHTGDPHCGTGIARGDNMTEHGGFIVHFFDRPLVDRLADGFSAPQVVAFEEGDLPRRLWRVAQRKERPVSQTMPQSA